MKKSIFIFVALFLLLHNQNAMSQVLNIINNTDRDIRNILITPENDKEYFFLRLDLAPRGKAQAENPDCTAALRIDTGLSFMLFDKINLSKIKDIEINNNAELKIIQINNSQQNIKGSLTSLLPQKGDKPVCELSRFRPKMPMDEVCGILPANIPQDDNGALLTGIGFAGLVWAGRLAPETNPVSAENPLLEHMELERPFSIDDLNKVLNYLQKQGYVLWQAEFPDADLDFADMPDQNQADRNNVLQEVIQKYLTKTVKDNGTIMLAPARDLQTLSNADNPEGDAQLFIITLRPTANKLLLDIAAYEANN